MNKRLLILCPLSGSNDYLAELGLNIVIDAPLADQLRVHLDALAANIRGTAASEGVKLAEFGPHDFPDADPDIEHGFYFAPAGSHLDGVTHQPSPYVALELSSDAAAEPLFTDATITRPQRDWLGQLIREHLALCLTSLGVDVHEARPYDN